jgi:hypothetical protein
LIFVPFTFGCNGIVAVEDMSVYLGIAIDRRPALNQIRADVDCPERPWIVILS